MSSEKGRNDIRPGQHPYSSTGRVEGGSESYEVYGTKGYYKTFQPQFKGRPLKHTEMDFNIDLIGQVIKGYRVVGSSLIPDEIDLTADLDKLLTFTSRDMIDAEGNTVFEDDGTTPKIEYIWELIDAGSLSGSKGDKGEPGTDGAKGSTGAQGLQGLTGAQGLTGVKGNTGAQGAQGIAGTPLDATLLYMYEHDTISPAGVPINQTRAMFFEMEGCLVLNVYDLNSTSGNSKLDKILAMIETGTFEITFVSQTGQDKYEHFTFKNAYVDTVTFAASDCIAIYVDKINSNPLMNPNANATGELILGGTLAAGTPIQANTFFDKWAQQTAYVSMVVVPYFDNVAAYTTPGFENNSFAVHEDWASWTIDSITASWGATTPISGNVWEITLVDSTGAGSVLGQYVHMDNTRVHTEKLDIEIGDTGTIWLNPDAPDGSAEGYTVTFKLVKY
jgi:hypothetical protein